MPRPSGSQSPLYRKKAPLSASLSSRAQEAAFSWPCRARSGVFLLVYSCEGLVQRDEPGGIVSGIQVAGVSGREEGHIHGHGLFAAAEAEESLVCQLFVLDLLSLVVVKAEAEPAAVVQLLTHRSLEGLRILFLGNESPRSQ